MIGTSYLMEYHNRCKGGEIVIGKELTTMLEILIEDMEFYKFDPTEAHKRIRFIEEKCCHSISPFAGKPFILELWQKAFTEACYGFYMEIDGSWYRRFNYATLIVARKNGKSSFAAALSLADFFCGNTGTNILLGSNDYEQAGILFDEVNNMREESTSLSRVSRKNLTGIFMGNPKQKRHKGKFTKQNKAKIKKLSVKTGGKEGRNLDMGVLDETHEMKDETLVMAVKQSTSTKDECLILEISTEGFTQDGHLDKHLIKCRQVLKREIEEPRHLVWLYSMDSEEEVWQKRESWTKANPNLGVSKKWSYLDELVNTAKSDPETRAFMLAKDFNIKQNSTIAWMNIEDIFNEDTFNLEDFKNAYYMGGNDFAETTDLCASTFLFYRDGIKYNHTMYWITKNKLENNKDDFDYQEAAKNGTVRVVDQTNIDTSIVADYQWEMFMEYGLKPYKSGIDRRYSTSYKVKFKEYFGEEILMDILQTAPILHTPMKTVEYDLKNKAHNYGNNPLTKWCFTNTGFKLDSRGNMQPAKISSERRIDGTASTVIAQAAYNNFAAEFERL